jgi:hypothetical protein
MLSYLVLRLSRICACANVCRKRWVPTCTIFQRKRIGRTGLIFYGERNIIYLNSCSPVLVELAFRSTYPSLLFSFDGKRYVVVHTHLSGRESLNAWIVSEGGGMASIATMQRAIAARDEM